MGYRLERCEERGTQEIHGCHRVARSLGWALPQTTKVGLVGAHHVVHDLRQRATPAARTEAQ